MKRHRRTWLNRLKSGKYPQGRYNLLSVGKYCCLGVAGVQCGAVRESAKNCVVSTEGREYRKVRRFLGLHDTIGSFRLTQEMRDWIVSRNIKPSSSLAELNDGGASHRQIAEFVEAFPEAVFKD